MFSAAWNAAKRARTEISWISSRTAGGIDTPSRRLFSGHKYHGYFCSALLVSVLVIFLTMIIPVPDRVSSILRGCSCIVIVLGCVLIFSTFLHQKKERRKKPVLRTFVWARLTFTEALHWQKCAKDQKPCMDFAQHDVFTCVDSVAPANNASPMHDSIRIENRQDICEEGGAVGIASPIDAITEASISITVLADVTVPAVEPLGQSPGIVSHMGDAALSPRSSSKQSDNSSQSNTSLHCPCCLDSLQNSPSIALLQCGHLYCEECIKAWASKSVTCPFCRASMLAST